jgi:hypothetical protein
MRLGANTLEYVPRGSLTDRRRVDRRRIASRVTVTFLDRGKVNGPPLLSLRSLAFRESLRSTRIPAPALLHPVFE